VVYVPVKKYNNGGTKIKNKERCREMRDEGKREKINR
jgi:hypothetical protein